MQCGWLTSGPPGKRDETWLKGWKLCHITSLREKPLRQFNQDGDSRRDNKHKCLKGAMVGCKLMLMLAASAMQMQCNRIKGALP